MMMRELGIRDDLQPRELALERIPNDRKRDVAFEIAVPYFSDRHAVECADAGRERPARNDIDTQRTHHIDLLHRSSCLLRAVQVCSAVYAATEISGACRCPMVRLRSTRAIPAERSSCMPITI